MKEQVSSSCKYDPFVPIARPDGQRLRKSFLKSKIYRAVFSKEGLSEGKDLEDIDISLTLSVLKPLHASCHYGSN